MWVSWWVGDQWSLVQWRTCWWVGGRYVSGAVVGRSVVGCCWLVERCSTCWWVGCQLSVGWWRTYQSVGGLSGVGGFVIRPYTEIKFFKRMKQFPRKLRSLGKLHLVLIILLVLTSSFDLAVLYGNDDFSI